MATTKKCPAIVRDGPRYMRANGSVVEMCRFGKNGQAWFEDVETGKQVGPCQRKWPQAIVYAFSQGWLDIDEQHHWPQMAKEFKSRGIARK